MDGDNVLVKRLLFWIVLVPLAAVLVVFSVANRGGVTLDLWPLPYQVDLPLYLVLLGALIVGFAAGGLYVALTGAARRARRDRAAVAGKTAPAPAAMGSLPDRPKPDVPRIPLKSGGAE